jgi:hypothetical protein
MMLVGVCFAAGLFGYEDTAGEARRGEGAPYLPWSFAASGGEPRGGGG